jgi:hypothetical protein
MENNFDCCRRLVGEIDIVLLLPSVQLYQGIGWLSGEMSNFLNMSATVSTYFLPLLR